MTSKLPVPSKVSELRFLRSRTLPGYAVLEFDTAANPIRVFLSRDKLELLVKDARITIAKLDSDQRIRG